MTVARAEETWPRVLIFSPSPHPFPMGFSTQGPERMACGWEEVSLPSNRAVRSVGVVEHLVL